MPAPAALHRASSALPVNEGTRKWPILYFVARRGTLPGSSPPLQAWQLSVLASGILRARASRAATHAAPSRAFFRSARGRQAFCRLESRWPATPYLLSEGRVVELLFQ